MSILIYLAYLNDKLEFVCDVTLDFPLVLWDARKIGDDPAENVASVPSHFSDHIVVPAEKCDQIGYKTPHFRDHTFELGGLSLYLRKISH